MDQLTNPIKMICVIELQNETIFLLIGNEHFDGSEGGLPVVSATL